MAGNNNGITPHLFKALTVQHIIEETKDFKTFVFSDGHNISYSPGQFLTLVHMAGNEEIRRSYSITSSPVLNEPLSIGVKRIANGIFSRKLIDTIRPGDTLLTTGAAGFFRLPDNINQFNTIFFFAAGSGITPIFSLVKTVLSVYPQVNVQLIYSNHSPATTIFYKELQQLARQFDTRLHIEFLFSTTPLLRKARLNRDLFIELLAGSNPDPAKTLFYTCGPEAYMRMVIYLLQELGYPKTNIKKEDFIPNRFVLSKAIPPGTGSYFVTLHFNGQAYRFKVNYPDTILTAAKKEKISLPYSCETGKCGNCVALCKQGKVWLSNNEVLTEDDLAKGLTLTCVGHPVNGDVVLQMGNI